MFDKKTQSLYNYNSLVNQIKKKEWSNRSPNETLFWIRRNYDNTADKFSELFKLIIDEFDDVVLSIEGMKKLFYYSAKGDNWIRGDNGRSFLEDDNIMILYNLSMLFNNSPLTEITADFGISPFIPEGQLLVKLSSVEYCPGC